MDRQALSREIRWYILKETSTELVLRPFSLVDTTPKRTYAMKIIQFFGLLLLCCGYQAKPGLADITTFNNGNEGWGVFFSNDGNLGDFLEASGGNPGAHLRSRMIDTFGMNFYNDSNPNFIGDYQRFQAPLLFQIDVQVNLLNFFGAPVSRNLILELVDYNPPGSTYPYVSVWYNLGEISAAQTGNWTTFSVMIDNPMSLTLPSGWGGTGDEDPNTFEPILPANRTFASVLQNVEEIRFTTFEPGFFYGFTDYQIRYDNPSLIAIPEPSGVWLFAASLLMFMGRRRRASN
jgi:hypothetical protein